MYTPILYTITGCVKCEIVKKFLNENQIPFKEVDILRSPQDSQKIMKVVGEIITPVFVYNRQWIEGDKLKEITMLLNNKSKDGK